MVNKNISLDDNYIHFIKKILGNNLAKKYQKHFILFYKFKKKEKVFFDTKKEILNLNSFLIEFLKHLKIQIKKKTKIIFFRHAKTSLNTGQFLGRKSNPSILKLKKRHKMFNFDVFYSSPLRRAVETASLLSKTKFTKCEELLEINYGLVEGFTINKMRNFYPDIINKWSNGIDAKFPKGESYQDVIKRTNFFLKNKIFTLGKDLKTKNIGVVTHNVILRCILGKYFKIEKKMWHKINIPYMTPLEFLYFRGNIRPNIPRVLLKKIFINFQ